VIVLAIDLLLDVALGRGGLFGGFGKPVALASGISHLETPAWTFQF
jgi:hypothetical protein